MTKSNLLEETEALLSGCGKEGRIKGFNLLKTGILPESIYPMPQFGNCDKKGLCSECKAKISGRLQAQKEEVEFLDKGLRDLNIGNFAVESVIHERIMELKQSINMLEEGLR